jgi:acetyltransferase-like isoleucine patch superfamily enzyme
MRPVGQRLRRARFLRQVRREAARANATVQIDVAEDLRVGDDVTVTFSRGSTNVLRIGPGCLIENRVTIALKGGQLLMGQRIELRRDVLLNVGGVLTMGDDSALSWGVIVHCSNEVVLEPMAGAAEYVTIADSSHYFTTPEEHFWHNVRKGTVRVGRNTWLCPKATVTRNADVGAFCIVASNTVVTGTVPDGSLASGVPAVVRPLPLPWRADVPAGS